MKQELQQKVAQLQQRYPQFDKGHQIWAAICDEVNIGVACDANGDAAAEIVAAVLEIQRQVKYINLPRCKVGDGGAAALANVLRDYRETSFICLNLNSNQVGDYGAKAIAAAWMCNTGLFLGIDLWGSIVGDSGAKAIGEALKCSTRKSGVTINLDCNQIGDEGAEAMANGIRNNVCRITPKIHWQGNRITKEIGAKIDQAVVDNGLLAGQADSHNKEGLRLLSEFKFQEALIKFQQANSVARDGGFQDNINSANQEIQKDNQAVNYNNQGLSLLQSGNYQEALNKFQQAYNTRQRSEYTNNINSANQEIQKDNQARDFNEEGLVLLQSGLLDSTKRQQALNKFQEACNTRSYDKYKTNKEQCTLLIEGDDYFNTQKYANAIEKYKQSIFSKDKPELFIQRSKEINEIAQNAMGSKMPLFEEAIKFIDEALRIQPNNLEAIPLKFTIFMNMSEVMVGIEHYDRAIVYLDKATEVDIEQVNVVKKAKGKIFNKQGKHEEALGCFVKGEDGFNEALVGIAKKHENEAIDAYGKELYDLALSALNKYENIVQQVSQGLITSQQDMKNVKGGILLKQGKHQEAIKYLDKDSIAYKDCMKAMLENSQKEAEDLVVQGKYVGAIKKYTEVLKEFPDNKDCLFGLQFSKGRDFDQNQKYKEAEGAFIGADNIQKNDYKCSIAISEVSIRLGNYDQAIRYLEGLRITQEVKNLKALSYNEKGKYHYDRGEYKDTVKCFELAQDNSNEAIYKKNYAHALLETGAYQKSIAIFKQINDQAGIAVAFNRYGTDYSEKGKYDSAKQCFEEACKLVPNNILYKNNLGFALLNSGAYKEAEKVFNEVLGVAIKDERALEGQEIVFNNIVKNNTTNVPDKVHYYKKLIELFGQNAKYLYELSQLYHGATELLLAKNCVKQAIKIDHNYQEAIDFYCGDLNGDIKDIFQ